MARWARAADGRTLVYETWGDPQGSPVFLLHGTPGSRLGPRPRAHELALMGIRLIAYDRPGYGLSDRHPGRRIADAAADVAVLADTLHLDRFGVVGRSGGAPHALACAALLPDRVAGAAALVGLAPRDAEGLDWFAGMGEGNVRGYGAASQAADAAGDPRRAADLVALLSQSTDSLVSLAFLDGQLPDVDREVVSDPGIRDLLRENFRQAVADERNLAVVPATPGGEGPDDEADRRPVLLGWLDDALALTGPWGFPLDAVRVPVLLWHGEEDVFCPVDHARWLAGRIPGSTLVVEPGSAHFGALVVLPSVLRWLRRLVPPQRSTA